ncbi:hypothetical protein JYT13_01030 [Mariprofundus ferrooxydans]|nr:hypothetical protein [Mariprofundus ferrooxydans]
MKKIVFIGLYVFALVFPVLAHANKIPFPRTSYEAISKASELKIPAAALFIVADESVGFDKNMIMRANEMMVEWLEPGRAIEVIRFSSGVKGRYTEVVTAGRLDPEPSEDFVDNLKRSELGKFQKLHRQQLRMAKVQAQKALLSIIRSSNKSVPYSDIVSNMMHVSQHIKQFKANRKVILVISDMFENSSVTTFYSKGHVKNINPDREIKKVSEAGMQADFGENVTVYVLGLGYFWSGEGSGKEKYLDPKRASKVAAFWTKYFEAGHAQVGEIGMPLMYGSMQ